MSLAVPYLLDAAADLAPQASITLPGLDITLGALDAGSARVAESFLGHGWAPGDRILLPDLGSATGLVVALAACRVGVRLAEADDGPTALAPVTARELAERDVDSATVLAELSGRTVTHGDVVNAAPVPAELLPLVVVVQQAFDCGVGR
ncbi:hypothetical protein [Nocardioides mangrovicus]|uniref:hypothetical protein n=1 Tax=Nocardioides mangrovicus TaxID=2478913 RepID=UPI001313FD87|nr:hypothetical protein [Nocardioides mangrovicus]